MNSSDCQITPPPFRVRSLPKIDSGVLRFRSDGLISTKTSGLCNYARSAVRGKRSNTPGNAFSLGILNWNENSKSNANRLDLFIIRLNVRAAFKRLPFLLPRRTLFFPVLFSPVPHPLCFPFFSFTLTLETLKHRRHHFGKPFSEFYLSLFQIPSGRTHSWLIIFTTSHPEAVFLRDEKTQFYSDGLFFWNEITSGERKRRQEKIR